MSDRKKKLIQGGFTSIPPGATAEELANKATAPERVAAIRAKLKDSNLLQESLRTPSPRHEGGNLSVGDDLDGSQMLLPAMEILLYDRNPRKSRNPQFNEIKESIRQKGVQHPPNVTKRPGADKYMVYGGGNTRLLAMQELWLETRDPKFERMMVFYRPWVNEASALAAHLVENEQRADMVFYDKVQGYMDLKREYENAFGPLSSRRFEELLKGDGLPASKTILHIYNYAHVRLSPLGQACYGLSKNSVRDVIQPRLNLAMRLAQRFDCDEDTYYTLIGNTMREYAAVLTAPENLDAAALCQACEQTLAANIGLAPNEIGTV
jgi:ParB family protein of integrating conjugative element (PFGI_1 class)